MQHVIQNVHEGTLPFMLDPAQARWVAWTTYACLRLSCGPEIPFAALTAENCGGNPITIAQLSILREMERANVWEETPGAESAWINWDNQAGGFMNN